MLKAEVQSYICMYREGAYHDNDTIINQMQFLNNKMAGSFVFV